MDILLFTNNRRKAEYCTLKLKAAGYSVSTVRTLAELHRKLRCSDPDFVTVDSETFPEPEHNYRSVIRKCRRKFLLLYSDDLSSLKKHAPSSELPDAVIKQLQADKPLSQEQDACIKLQTDILSDLQVHKALVNETFSASSADERLFLKENRLRPPLALLLSCFLRNQDTDIETATLLSFLWADDAGSHLQTLYAYINQLRMLLESRNIPLVIEKRQKGTYRIRMLSELLLSDSGIVQT